MKSVEVKIYVSCIAMVVTLLARSGSALADQPPESAKSMRPAVCKLAVVNPVSGYAECVDPSGAPVDPPPARPVRVRLAVFDFELDDATPASALLGQSTSDAAAMGKVSQEARLMFARSGRYAIVDVSDVDVKPVRDKTLRNCDGCEAGIALDAGAEQAVIGVVRRVTQTDYYIVIQLTDAKTGKVLNQQSANFAGGPEGWAAGARMLLKHQVLVSDRTDNDSSN
jgi:Protein of unknown function (DUF2380)